MRTRMKLLAIILLLAVAAAGQAMIATLKLPDLVRKSEIIALVTVISSAGMTTDKEHVTTVRNELKPEKLLKGSWKPAEPFIVMTRESGKPGQPGWIEDQPQFPPKGQQCVVFLQRDKDGVLEIVNLVQGIWPIIEGKPAGMGLGTQLSQIEELAKQQAD